MTKEDAYNRIDAIIAKHEIDDEYVTVTNEKDYNALKIARKALKQTTWIPVSERLPENGTYLICTDDGYIATIQYDRSMGWLLNANIIAWMPLPQPYKAESEE